MARTKAILGLGVRLSDRISASLLARVYDPELVQALLAEHGAQSRRIRDLPAMVTAYYCMALSLYPEAAYESVFDVVAQGLATSQGDISVKSSSISAARTRLGVAPLKSLHERACPPLADPIKQPHAFYAGLRLVALDGSVFDLPDEKLNAAEFGYPGGNLGRAGYPQAHCTVLVECATHAILHANIGKFRQTERELCEPLLSQLKPDMLCLADRGFTGYELWKRASASGAQLLWRCRNNRQLPVIERLADGSYLSAIYPDVAARRTRQGEVIVRVIDYALPGLPDAQPRYRLMTTLRDPLRAPALELASLYHERWEVEAVFDELKTHLSLTRRTLRSKTPDGVRQEFYGWVLAHYAVCWLMHQAASEHRLRQRQLSFTGHVRLLRREQPQSGDFPPKTAAKARSVV
jgi:hypothetical protein